MGLEFVHTILKKERTMRPQVKAFAEEMERTLKINDYKGGWEGMDHRELRDKLDEEVDEVKTLLGVIKAMSECGMDTIIDIAGVEAVDKLRIHLLRECADVANIAMMIADNFAKLDNLAKMSLETPKPIIKEISPSLQGLLVPAVKKCEECINDIDSPNMCLGDKPSRCCRIGERYYPDRASQCGNFIVRLISQ
jgi:hypothetical protein